MAIYVVDMDDDCSRSKMKGGEYYYNQTGWDGCIAALSECI